MTELHEAIKVFNFFTDENFQFIEEELCVIGVTGDMEGCSIEQLLGYISEKNADDSGYLLSILRDCEEIREIIDLKLMLSESDQSLKIDLPSVMDVMGRRAERHQHKLQKSEAEAATIQTKLSTAKKSLGLDGHNSGGVLDELSCSAKHAERKACVDKLVTDLGIDPRVFDVAALVFVSRYSSQNTILGAPSKIRGKASKASRDILKANEKLRLYTQNIRFINALTGDTKVDMFFREGSNIALPPDTICPVIMTPATEDLVRFYTNRGLSKFLDSTTLPMDANCTRFVNNQSMIPNELLSFRGTALRGNTYSSELAAVSAALLTNDEEGSMVVGKYTIAWGPGHGNRNRSMTWTLGAGKVELLVADKALEMDRTVPVDTVFTHNGKNYVMPEIELTKPAAAEGWINFQTDGITFSKSEEMTSSLTMSQARFVVNGMVINHSKVKAQIGTFQLLSANIAVQERNAHDARQKTSAELAKLSASRPSDRTEAIVKYKSAVTAGLKIEHVLKMLRMINPSADEGIADRVKAIVHGSNLVDHSKIENQVERIIAGEEKESQNNLKSAAPILTDPDDDALGDTAVNDDADRNESDEEASVAGNNNYSPFGLQG